MKTYHLIGDVITAIALLVAGISFLVKGKLFEALALIALGNLTLNSIKD